MFVVECCWVSEGEFAALYMCEFVGKRVKKFD